MLVKKYYKKTCKFTYRFFYMKIIQATPEHLEDLVPLFDEYRIFYRQKSDQNAVREFLKERLTKQDSVIYLAYIDNIAVGFTQLYSLLSSVSMQPMYLLNDLYINSNYRNRRIGTSFIKKAITRMMRDCATILYFQYS